MDVIITGASGFIGKNFLLEAPREWNITAIYFNSLDFIDFLGKHGLTHVKPLRCNLTDPTDISKSLVQGGQEPDVVIYLAANSDPSYSVEHPLEDLSKNTVSLMNFLNNCPCNKLLYLSSGAVYDGLEGLVNPSKAVTPTLPYAISKLATEQYIKYFQKKGKIKNYVILRFFGAYGPYEPKRKIFTRLINALVFQKANEFDVVGDGHNLIDAMYVDDAIRGILKVISSDHENLIVDFASGVPITINELVEKVARILGKSSVTINHVGETSEYITFFVSTHHMQKCFGFLPSTPLEEGIRMLLHHFRKNKE